MGEPGEVRRPTWEALLRAMAVMMDRGHELVMVATTFPGDGFERWVLTVREKPGPRGED